MRRSILLLIILICLSLVNISCADVVDIFTPTKEEADSKLKGYALYVPAGVSVEAVLSNEINSQSAVIGQNINAILIDDFKYNNKIIASEGSIISGSVVQNKKAGFGNRNAKIQVKFTTIRTPYNNIIPISAVIMTDDLSGILRAASFKDSAVEYLKNTAIGTGSGAVAGSVAGAISDNSIGKSTIYGAVIGAGAGIVKTACEKGDSIVIPANSKIMLYFNQPITLGAQ